MRIWNSLRTKIIGIIAIILVPLLLFLTIIGFRAIDVVRKQSAEMITDLLTLHTKQIESNLHMARVGILDILNNDESIKALKVNSEDDFNYSFAKLNLVKKLNELRNEITYLTFIDTFFVYFEKTDTLLISSPASNYSRRNTLLNENIKAWINSNEFANPKEWQMVHEDEDTGLIKIFTDYEGTYVGAWVNIATLINPLKSIDLEETGGIVCIDSDMSVVASTSDLSEVYNEIKNQTPNDENSYTVTIPDTKDKFLIVKKSTEFSDMQFIAVIPENILMKDLKSFQKTLSLIPFIVILILVVYLVSLRGLLFKPIGQIVNGMEEVSKGNFDIKLKEYGVNEFIFLISTFNQMTQQIKKLKIDVYEEKIKAQKAELKHLQVQIQPHFFANSLNTIYNLAFLKDFQSVQKMAKYLVDYYRFLIKTDKSVVSIRDECKHIANYLEIQKFRFPDKLNYEILISERFMDCLIPPLCLQTFVENSIIHGFKEKNELLYITITSREYELEENSYIEIVIMDNGNGFNEKVLEIMQQRSYMRIDTGEHVGIYNVYRRLQMYYEGNVDITFENRLSGGAAVTLRLPKKYNKDGVSSNV